MMRFWLWMVLLSGLLTFSSGKGQCCYMQRPDVSPPAGVERTVPASYDFRTGFRSVDYSYSFQTNNHLFDFHTGHAHMYEGTALLQQHTLRGVYSIGNLVLTGRGSYYDNQLEMLPQAPNRQLTPFVQSAGLGDLFFHILFPLFKGESSQFHGNLGGEIPTGSISEKIATTHGTFRQPYILQPGTGVFSIAPALHFYHQRSRWSTGAEASGLIRLGRNEHQYQPGHQLETTVWGSYQWWETLSPSIRFQGVYRSEMKGDDLQVPLQAIPPSGIQLLGHIGVNYWIQQGGFANNLLAIEVGKNLWSTPLFQKQMTTFIVTARWKKRFQ